MKELLTDLVGKNVHIIFNRASINSSVTIVSGKFLFLEYADGFLKLKDIHNKIHYFNKQAINSIDVIND